MKKKALKPKKQREPETDEEQMEARWYAYLENKACSPEGIADAYQAAAQNKPDVPSFTRDR